MDFQTINKRLYYQEAVIIQNYGEPYMIFLGEEHRRAFLDSFKWLGNYGPLPVKYVDGDIIKVVSRKEMLFDDQLKAICD